MAAASPTKSSAKTRNAAHDDVWIAQQLGRTLGGRFSRELGIDTDRGGREIDRWFLAATLFGTRISADVAKRSWDELVKLLDEGGYVRYDFSTATRLLKLAEALAPHKRRASALLSSDEGKHDPVSALDRLPGWGPTTIRLFLRELGQGDQLDPRTEQAAHHLKLKTSKLADLAHRASLDPRDLEAALVRLSLHHAREMERCPGGTRCSVIGNVA